MISNFYLINVVNVINYEEDYKEKTMMEKQCIFGYRYITIAKSLISEFEGITDILDIEKGDKTGRARECLKNLIYNFKGSLESYIKEAVEMKQILEFLKTNQLFACVDKKELNAEIEKIKELITNVEKIINQKGF